MASITIQDGERVQPGWIYDRKSNEFFPPEKGPKFKTKESPGLFQVREVPLEKMNHFCLDTGEKFWEEDIRYLKKSGQSFKMICCLISKEITLTEYYGVGEIDFEYAKKVTYIYGSLAIVKVMPNCSLSFDDIKLILHNKWWNHYMSKARWNDILSKIQSITLYNETRPNQIVPHSVSAARGIYDIIGLLSDVYAKDKMKSIKSTLNILPQSVESNTGRKSLVAKYRKQDDNNRWSLTKLFKNFLPGGKNVNCKKTFILTNLIWMFEETCNSTDLKTTYKSDFCDPRNRPSSLESNLDVEKNEPDHGRPATSLHSVDGKKCSKADTKSSNDPKVQSGVLSNSNSFSANTCLQSHVDRKHNQKDDVIKTNTTAAKLEKESVSSGKDNTAISFKKILKKQSETEKILHSNNLTNSPKALAKGNTILIPPSASEMKPMHLTNVENIYPPSHFDDKKLSEVVAENFPDLIQISAGDPAETLHPDVRVVNEQSQSHNGLEKTDRVNIAPNLSSDEFITIRTNRQVIKNKIENIEPKLYSSNLNEIPRDTQETTLCLKGTVAVNSDKLPKERIFVEKRLNFSSPSSGSKYELPLKVTFESYSHVKEIQGIKHYYYKCSNKTVDDERKTIIIFGSDDCGKATLLNLLWKCSLQNVEENYSKFIVGGSDFNFKELSFYHFGSNNFGIKEMVVIVTPSLTNLISEKVEKLFCDGVLNVNALGFVADSRSETLTSEERRFFNLIRSSFGEVSNHHLMTFLLFCEFSRNFPVLEDMKKLSIRPKWVFELNGTNVSSSSSKEAKDLEEALVGKDIKMTKKIYNSLVELPYLSIKSVKIAHEKLFIESHIKVTNKRLHEALKEFVILVDSEDQFKTSVEQIWKLVGLVLAMEGKQCSEADHLQYIFKLLINICSNMKKNNKPTRRFLLLVFKCPHRNITRSMTALLEFYQPLFLSLYVDSENIKPLSLPFTTNTVLIGNDTEQTATLFCNVCKEIHSCFRDVSEDDCIILKCPSCSCLGSEHTLWTFQDSIKLSRAFCRVVLNSFNEIFNDLPKLPLQVDFKDFQTVLSYSFPQYDSFLKVIFEACK